MTASEIHFLILMAWRPRDPKDSLKGPPEKKSFALALT